jgi:hypothetical protein
LPDQGHVSATPLRGELLAELHRGVV